MYRKIIAATLISLASLGAAFVLQLSPPVKLFSLKGGDLQFKLFAQSGQADPRIVLITVDQASLDHFEKDNIPFPWPRSLYNPIIEYCTQGGAKALIFDILYNNNSPYGVEVDKDFAAAIKASGRVYLAAAFSRGSDAGVLPDLSRFGLAQQGKAAPSLERKSASLALPPLLDAATGIGNVNSRNDADGVFRRVIPFTTSQGRLIPILGAAAVIGEGSGGRFVENTLVVAGRTIPLDGDGAMLINYHGPRGTYRSYSAANVITSALKSAAGEVPPIPKEAFRDAYIFVGYTALGLFDNKATPLSPISPGMEIHANLLDNILNKDFLTPATRASNLFLSWVAAILVTAGVLLLNSVLAWAAAIVILSGALFFLLWRAFAGGYLVDLWTVTTTILAAVILSSAYRYWVEEKDRRFVAKAFGRYVSPQILAELTAHPETLALGGKKAVLTLLFSDLQGFTTISEKLPPEKVVQFLNLHMTAMSNIIYRHGGTIQTFLGDGIFAFWGAPVENPDHALLACRAAVEMLEENQRLSPELVQAGYEPAVLRIGLNSGPVVVGNMGSAERFDYTPIGDSVNLAARLEGVNKLYKTGILLSASTAAEVGDRLALRRVDKVRVKGKDEPIEIFTPCPDDDLREAAEEAIAAYRSQEWDVAECRFKQILDRWPGDSISSRYLQRITRFRQSPPADGTGWDGSVSLEKM